jgi:hypothetical protein
VSAPNRRVFVIAFNFEELFALEDEALVERFLLVRRVNPALIPRGFRPQACRITRTRRSITLHFYQREISGEYGPEVFRFSFRRPPNRRR